jgi:hypothetical protein
MQQEGFLSIQGAAERLAELGRPLSADRLRGLIDGGQLPCAVYWVTRSRWMYVTPPEASHHEACGWPRWAVDKPEDIARTEANSNPGAVWFTADEDDPFLYTNLLKNLIKQEGGEIGSSLQLALFRAGLFIPVAAIEALAAGGKPSGEKHPAPVSRTEAQDKALLVALKKAGYDPLNLPKNNLGERGVKAAMKEALKDSHFFTPSAFDHAWKRLKKLQHLR